jgi:hypothetical protein
MIRCVYCRYNETPEWGVTSIAYSHSAGELSHYCSSGRRISVSVDDLTGPEREWAESMVGKSSSASRANARKYADQ